MAVLGMLAKAAFRATQRASRSGKIFPDSMQPTMGQTCSTGFMSGLFGGHFPWLNCRIPSFFRNAVVVRALCTGAPSCWNVPRRWFLQRTLGTGEFPCFKLLNNAPALQKTQCRCQNCLIVHCLELCGAPSDDQAALPVHGHPDHQAKWFLNGGLHRLGLKFAAGLLPPGSHQHSRACPEHLFIGKVHVLPLLHRPLLIFSPKYVASLDVLVSEHGPLDHPSVDKAQFLQEPSH